MGTSDIREIFETVVGLQEMDDVNEFHEEYFVEDDDPTEWMDETSGTSESWETDSGFSFTTEYEE